MKLLRVKCNDTSTTSTRLHHQCDGHWNHAEQAFPDAPSDSYRVTADELRQFIERWERLEAEKQDIAEQQKEVMAEAKGRGYDTKVMRQVIARRKRERDDLAEEEAVLGMYEEALGAK